MNKLLYIHIPKNGGLSMRKAIPIPDGVPMSATHATIGNWRDMLGKERFAQYRTVTVLRHPCARFVSAWSYLKQQGPAHVYWWADAAERSALAQYHCTYDLLSAMKENITLLPHFGRQQDWLEFPADYQMHLETITGDYKALKHMYSDLPPMLGHTNTSWHKPWQEYLAKDEQQWIADIYSGDMELGGYEL